MPFYIYFFSKTKPALIAEGRFVFGFGGDLLRRSDGTHRADIGASAAVYAEVGVDAVNVAFADGALRAFADAGSAGDAGVFVNFVSHFLYLLVCCFRRYSGANIIIFHL